MYIERISWPTSKVFYETYVENETPVVIENGLAGCPASSWTPEKICSLVGHKILNVAIASNQGVFGYTRTGAAYRTQEMELSSAVAQMSGESELKYYIMQIPVRRDLPELENDIALPPVVDPRKFTALNFWLSTRGDITPLHYDRANNFLAQMYGHKEVTLISPIQSTFVYPLGAGAHHPHISQVDYLNPDYAAHPLFAKANKIRLTLKAGDVLFLPAFWWHGVETLEMSISLNFWWKILPPQFLSPVVIEALVETYNRTKFKHDLDAEGSIAAARHALLRNLAWAAGLLAAAALDQHSRHVLARLGAPSETIPGRLDMLNEAITRLDKGLAINTEKIKSWMRLTDLCRKGDNGNVAPGDVAAMVEGIAEIVGSGELLLH